MKKICISEEDFKAVMEEILRNIKADGADKTLMLMTEAFGRMVRNKLFDGRFATESEDANMGEEEYKTEIQKMVEESVREAMEELGI